MPSEPTLSPDGPSLQALRLIAEHGPLTGPQLDDLMTAAGRSPLATKKAITCLRKAARIVRAPEGYQVTSKGRDALTSFDAGSALRTQADAQRAARQAVPS